MTDCLPPCRDLSRNWLFEALDRTADRPPASRLAFEERSNSTSPVSSTSEGPNTTETFLSGLPDRGRDHEENDITNIISDDKIHQTDYGSRIEYAWDPGPVDLLPYNFEECLYDSDRGPYNPATFDLDELDKEFDIFTAGHCS